MKKREDLDARSVSFQVLGSVVGAVVGVVVTIAFDRALTVVDAALSGELALSVLAS